MKFNFSRAAFTRYADPRGAPPPPSPLLLLLLSVVLSVDRYARRTMLWEQVLLFCGGKEGFNIDNRLLPPWLPPSSVPFWLLDQCWYTSLAKVCCVLHSIPFELTKLTVPRPFSFNVVVLVCSTNNLRRRVCVTATKAQLSRSWYFNSVCAAADHAHRKILANMLSLAKSNNNRKLTIAKKNIEN